MIRHIISVVLLCTICISTYAQNNFTAVVKDKENQEPLPGASVFFPDLSKGSTTNHDGRVVFRDIPNGNQNIRISYIGYKTLTTTVSFPIPDSLNDYTISLSPSAHEMEEITISSTRSSRTIEDIPTRVEFIAGEELSEKGNMKPGDIRMLLNESTGIQTQQTSATSYNSSIRIQGLDGKYTQLLRDGMPLYSGFSGGLSLMQIAPLDLKQVEVIKGSSSTLYGGGAIAGLVNLISKTPTEERELSFMANGTSALGLDVSGFYSKKNDKIGTTIFSSYNKGTPYDPANIGLTAIPKFDRFTFNPKLFLYLNDDTELNIGLNYITEDRLGGNMDYVEGDNSDDAYFEENLTDRVSSQIHFSHQFSPASQLNVKNSLNYYDRTINVPTYSFDGTQFSSFSEINYNQWQDKSEWILGLNLWTDRFTQNDVTTGEPLDYTQTTWGAFAQNTWNPLAQLAIETGLRTDYQTDYGLFILPRISIMYTPINKLTMRLGGGLGYKTPTIFAEEAERIQFKNVMPIDNNELDAERSVGSNLDINYKTAITSELDLNTNLLLFYTRINDPIQLEPTGSDLYTFEQSPGYIDTKGVEVNIRLSYHDFKLFIGYTYADVNVHENNNSQQVPLVAKHRLNNVLMYEKEENFWIGVEAYYYSPQKLSDGDTGQSYWIVGLMSEKTIGDHFSIFLNFENFLDTRQTAFDTIYTGSIDNPTFRDIYAPVDGFVMNGGIKIKL
ncbi:TonB-dependent receptor [Fulvivirga maritima]|uniref:TonB-dependent receptor n=1 Tax=Fulvivirga maritima TaxID=2904247 RepID=UPI001F2ABE3F|nr:TonB-dependent receptor [Fulvivirga maritima]UII25832.1 TonB-dependent receptor [Fulvivirga maritima]